MTARQKSKFTGFDEERHRYYWEGDPFPSVTTINEYAASSQRLKAWIAKTVATEGIDGDDHLLMDRDEAIKWLSKAADRVRDVAGLRGTQLHDYAEQLIHTGVIPPGLSDDQLALVESVASFIKDFRPQFNITEGVVFNRTHRYAGKFDAICEIPGCGHILLDWKSGSTVVAKFATQLVAYRRAEVLLLADTLTPMPEVDATWIVKIGPDGYQVLPCDSGDFEWDAFLAARTLYDFNLACERKGSTPLKGALEPPAPQLSLVPDGNPFAGLSDAKESVR